MRQVSRARVASFLFCLCLLAFGLGACDTMQPADSAKGSLSAQPLGPQAVAQGMPQSPVMVAPRMMTAPLQQVQPGARRRAALLLPLSGPQGALGQSLQKAAMLAVQELAPQNFELAVYDTNKGAIAAFEAARRGGAQLLIGPLFSQDALAIRTAALQAGIPMLTLSNDVTLAGQNTYVTGFWPGAQIARVVDYAARQRVTTLAALVPDDAYGQRVATALVQGRRVRVMTIRYSAGATPAQVALALAAHRGSYDGLLLAENGTRAGAIMQALTADGGLLVQDNGRRIPLFGPGLWDDAEAAAQPALAGGSYAAPEPAGFQAFAVRYRQAFGDTPPRLASLGYDATALAAVLARQNLPYAPQALGQAQGFDGTDGLFRLRGDGLVERGLGILQLQPAGSGAGPRLVEPAPRAFQ